MANFNVLLSPHVSSRG